MLNTFDVYKYLIRTMKTKNLLLEPGRMALGGFFYRLSSGVYIFEKERFDFLSFQSDSVHYVKYYEQIASVFLPCAKFHNIQYHYCIDIPLLLQMLEKKGVHVHILEMNDQYEFYKKNAYEVLTELPKCFSFPRKFDAIGERLKAHKGITASCHLRYCCVDEKKRGTYQQNFYRRIREMERKETFDDLRYLEWLVSEYDVRSYFIGDRDQKSAYRPPDSKVKKLYAIPNAKILFDEPGTDIRHDLYLILHADVHISIGGGGLGTIAMLLGKPVLMFDMTRSPEIVKYPLYPNVSGYHAIYLERTLIDKKKLTKNFFLDLQRSPHVTDRWNANSVRIRKILGGLFRAEKFDISKWNGAWQCFDEAYGVLAEYLLELRDARRAWDCIKRLDDFNLFRLQKKLYLLARKFQDLKEYAYANYLFEYAFLWADTLKLNQIKSAILYHQGEMLIDDEAYDNALECFRGCLAIMPEHKKAQDCCAECLRQLEKKIVLWGRTQHEIRKLLEQKKISANSIKLIICDDCSDVPCEIWSIPVNPPNRIASLSDSFNNCVTIVTFSGDNELLKSNFEFFLKKLRIETPFVLYFKA